MLGSLLALSISVLLVWIITRLPMVIFPRLRIRANRMEPHPAPVAIDESLIIAMLRMRRSYWLAIPFALVPLGYGLIMLRFIPTSIGFGLTVGAGWVVLSRTLPASLDPRRRAPYALALIHDLNRVRLLPASCCEAPTTRWESDAVRCERCRAVHLAEARPDLGRSRCDGWILGGLRLLLLDGRPATEPTEESEIAAPKQLEADLPVLV